jgi:hypothetical protein
MIYRQLVKKALRKMLETFKIQLTLISVDNITSCASHIRKIFPLLYGSELRFCLPYKKLYINVLFNIINYDMGQCIQNIEEAVTVQLVNVSAGGALFVSNKEFPLDTQLDMKLDLNGWLTFRDRFYKSGNESDSPMLCVTARVLRMKEISPYGFHIAVTFTTISPQDTHVLNAYLQHLL